MTSPWREIAVALLAVLGLSDPVRSEALAGFSVTHWSETDGPLPYGVYAIAQDREGYLWLGGRLGLIRFDGLSFTVWNERVNLPEERVSTIRIARDDAIWIGFGASEGIVRISPDRTTALRYAPADGVARGNIKAIIEDEDGTIWVGGYGGLSSFRDGRWHPQSAADGLPSLPVHALYRDSRHALWVGTGGGIYMRRSPDAAFTWVAADLAAALAEDNSGTLWVAAHETPLKSLQRTPRARATVSGRGTALLVDRNGDLWIGTEGSGLMRRRATEGMSSTIERFTRESGSANDVIHSVYQDRDGSIWVGTRGGLTRLAETSITPMRGPWVDEKPYVYAVLASRHAGLWMGTGEGLIRIDGGSLKRYAEDDGLPGPIVTALHEDSAGTIWVATTSGIGRWRNGRFVPIKYNNQQPRGSRVYSLTSDALGRLWICDSNFGLLRWHAGRLEHIDFDPRRGPPNVAYTDSKGRVWIGYWGSGVDVYDGVAKVTYSMADGLPRGGVNAIFEDSQQILWFGTTAGLAAFENGRFYSLASNGVPQGSVTSIIEDPERYLWFGLGSNLLRLNVAEFQQAKKEPGFQLRHRRFGPEDGLSQGLGRAGSPNAALRADGSLVFLTSLGPMSVQPDRLKAPAKAGPARIDTVVADGQEFTFPERLQFAPHTSRIEINYSTLSLAPSANLGFRYKLEGFDSDWQNIGQRRQAVYTNLAPGDYVFHLARTNSDGVWDHSAPPLAFSISPAFVQTRTFIALCAIALSAAIGAIWQLRLRIVKERFRSVLGERVRVAQDLHDTLLQSLVAVALEFDDIAAQLDASASDLHDQVIEMRERIEHYIRETRLSIWQLRSPLLEAGGLAEALRNYGQLSTSGSSTAFQCYERGSRVHLDSSVEQELLRIGQEAIINAMRHADPDTIAVEVYHSEDSVTLRVIDDGSGFDPQTAREGHSHWGLATMAERAERIEGRLRVKSQPGNGTTVEVIAPVIATSSGKRW